MFYGQNKIPYYVAMKDTVIRLGIMQSIIRNVPEESEHSTVVYSRVCQLSYSPILIICKLPDFVKACINRTKQGNNDNNKA